MLTSLALLGSLVAVAPSVEREVEEAPRFRGVGMFIGSALFGVPALGLKSVGTLSDPETARELDRDPGSNFCIESCYVGTLLNPMSAPFWVHSIGFFGTGMTLRARFIAHKDLRSGRDRSRTAHVATGAGFVLIGTGVLALVASQAFTRTRPMSEYDGVVIREIGWWSSLALGYAGAGLAGWGVGYKQGRSEFGPSGRISVAPLAAPRFVGLSLSGRF